MAFEGLLRAWSDERIAWRDAQYCIVDKPAGSAGGPVASARAPSSPTALVDRLVEHGLGSCWVVCGVPERASGAVLVARGEPPVGHAQRPSPIDTWTSVVAVDDWRLPSSGAFAVADPAGSPPLEYRVERRHEGRALVRVRGKHPPEVVVRVLRERHQPIVGDESAPTAARATRLMLHVTELEGAVHGRAPLPSEFESWLSGHAVLEPERFAEALASAGVSRHGLGVDAVRLLGEEAGEIAGVSVERYSDHVVLYVSSEQAERLELEMADCLMDHGAAGVYVKRRVRADLRRLDPTLLAPPQPIRGQPAPEWLELRPGAMRCSVNLGDGLATGLFLDQRANWERVHGWARGGAWLNLFCYTGAFTLAAAAGGASATTSVDLAGRALSRLATNLELNGWTGPQHRLLRSDVPAWLARAQRASRRFDGVILDPPSFGTRARGVLSTRRDNARLVDAALGVLLPGGRLVCVSHHRKISDGELREQLHGACERVGVAARIEPLVGAWDCPTLPGVTPTKSVLAHLT